MSINGGSDAIAAERVLNEFNVLPNRTVIFITSDNFAAQEQMMSVVNQSNFSFMSPQGCHIEWDESWQCYSLTAKYWFILSLSNVIVTQTVGHYNAPTSAFSRFAGIYGLHADPFRSARNCNTVTPTFVLSQIPSGNWFCSFDLNYDMRQKGVPAPAY